MIPFPFFNPDQASYPVYNGTIAKDANPANSYPNNPKISAISRFSEEGMNLRNVLNFICSKKESTSIPVFDTADINNVIWLNKYRRKDHV